MYNDFDIDLFNEDYEPFDLIDEYNVYTEGVKKQLRKAAKKMGVELSNDEFNAIKEKAKEYKHGTPRYEKLAEGPEKDKDKFLKGYAKSYIKSEISSRSSNPRYMRRNKKYNEKFGEYDSFADKADKENSKKVIRRKAELEKGEGYSYREKKKLTPEELQERVNKHTTKEEQGKFHRARLAKLQRDIDSASKPKVVRKVG